MRVDNNNCGGGQCAFKGIYFEPKTTQYIVKNVKNADDCMVISEAIPSLRNSSSRDFSFRMQDGSLKCVITTPVAETYGKVANQVNETLTATSETIADLFKRCHKIAISVNEKFERLNVNKY